MKINRENSLFCLVDVQEKLFPHVANCTRLEENLIKLVQGLTILNVPFIVNEQYKKGIGATIPAVAALITNQPHFEKTTFSSCGNSDTLAAIKQHNKTQVIVAGIEAHVCVMQTCLDLLEQGLQPILVCDCISSRKASDMDFAVQRLIQAGVIPTTYESLLFELTGDSKDPLFKNISALIK